MFALGAVLDALDRAGGQGDAFLGAFLGVFRLGCLGLLHGGVDVGLQVRGLDAGPGVADGLQVHLAQVFLVPGEAGGGQDRSGDEQA